MDILLELFGVLDIPTGDSSCRSASYKTVQWTPQNSNIINMYLKIDSESIELPTASFTVPLNAIKLAVEY